MKAKMKDDLDSLDSRIKTQYESRTSYLLPRRTYTMIRIDGRAFHQYTKDLDRPYDSCFMEDMDQTAVKLCEKIEGARVAYVQSDEITIVMTDFETLKTQAWFDGNIQKIASISSSIATAEFNKRRIIREVRRYNNLIEDVKLAQFDSRVFTIPDRTEVINALIWRQNDATRNSISMAARSMFSHDQLLGKSSNELQELMWQEKGVNWNDYNDGFKRGRCAVHESIVSDVEYTDTRTGERKNSRYGCSIAAGRRKRSWICTGFWSW